MPQGAAFNQVPCGRSPATVMACIFLKRLIPKLMAHFRRFFARYLPLLLSLAVLVQALGGGAALSSAGPGESLEAALRVICSPTSDSDTPDTAPAAHTVACCLTQCRFDLLHDSALVPQRLVWASGGIENQAFFAESRISLPTIAALERYRPRAPPHA